MKSVFSFSAALIFTLSLIPMHAFAQSDSLNAGFVSGIWYSKQPFFAGETIRIYAAVQNQSVEDISGVISFFNAGEKIGERTFDVINGRLVENWIDWTATYGDHAFSVELTEIQASLPGENPVEKTLLKTDSTPGTIFVDLDTDGDGIGNEIDTDDDGDSISDTEENEIGTNALEVDTDGDGLTDGEEVSSGSNSLDPDDPVPTTDSNNKNDGNNSADPHTESTLSLEEGIEKVKEIIPDGAKETASKMVGAINTTAEKLQQVINEKREDTEKVCLPSAETGQLSSAAVSTEENMTRFNFFAKCSAEIALNIASFILGNKLLFYSIVVICTLIAIKLIWCAIKLLIRFGRKG